MSRGNVSRGNVSRGNVSRGKVSRYLNTKEVLEGLSIEMNYFQVYELNCLLIGILGNKSHSWWIQVHIYLSDTSYDF